MVINKTTPPTEPLLPLDAYAQKVQSSRARGTVYPYELIPLLTGTKGTFVEHDFDEAGVLSPVERPYGLNKAGIVVGLVNTPTPRYPEGMTRVALFGDPTKALGTVAEAECSRVVAAIDLAEKLNAPVEWFALSSGATISMESGTENMDWVSRGLRRIDRRICPRRQPDCRGLRRGCNHALGRCSGRLGQPKPARVRHGLPDPTSRS